MSIEYVKDAVGKILGKIVKHGTKTYLHDANMKALGFYDPSTNTTHTATGKLVGRGNLLMTLIR